MHAASSQQKLHTKRYLPPPSSCAHRLTIQLQNHQSSERHSTHTYIIVHMHVRHVLFLHTTITPPRALTNVPLRGNVLQDGRHVVWVPVAVKMPPLELLFRRRW